MSRFKFDEAVRVGKGDASQAEYGLDKLRASLVKGARATTVKPKPDTETIRKVAEVGQAHGLVSRTPIDSDRENTLFAGN